MAIELEREPFKLILCPGLWRGVDLAVTPATPSYPMRHFRSRDEALAAAEALSKATSWPILDKTAGDDG